MKTKALILFVVLNALVISCVPALQTVVTAPQFTIRGEVELISIELPLPFISSGQIIFRVPMEIYNPNNFEATITSVDFDFSLNNKLAISSSFSDGVRLAAQGRTTVPLDIIVPLENGLAIIEDVTGLLAGQTTNYAMDGRVTLDVLGVAQIYAKTRLFSGQIN